MSLVIKKFEPGGKTTQPRLYKRGNDDIDLDAYIRDAESEFSYWLANSRLKDKLKQLVQEAYSQMLLGINDGTFTYKVGGGYNNSVGMSNKTKGFDAAGLAAGFLGNVLRRQNIYKAPEEKPDPSKILWKGNSSIGSALIKHIYGSDKENLNDFIDLDPFDTQTKKRGNANRSARFKAGLEHVRDNFDNLFTSFSDADKASALEGINSAIAAFDNGTVEDNEYLDLGRATGLSNLRDMFFSGEKYGSTPQPQAAQSIPDGTAFYTNEDEYRSAKHPRTTITDFTRVPLTTTAVYKKEGRVKLNLILLGLSKDKLLKLVLLGIKYGPNGLELNRGRSIQNGFGQLTSFANSYIMGQALKVLLKKGYLHLFTNDPNSYYVPFVSDKLDLRRTGFVYKVSPDGNHSIVETDRYDIPFYTSQWHNEFTSQIPSSKNGGVLRKFAVGGVSNVKYNANKYSWDDIIYGSNQFASVLGGLNLLNYLDANALLNRYFTDKINDKWNEGTIGKRDVVSQYQSDFNTAYGTHLNQGAIEDAIKSGRITRVGSTGDNLAGNYTDGYSGAMTNLRHLGTSDHVGHILEMNKILNQNGLEAFLNEETNMINYRPIGDPIAARKAVVASTTSPDAVSEELLFGGKEEHSDAWKKVFGLPSVGKDEVDERFLPALKAPGSRSFGAFMGELTPDLIGAGRLWASLHTNNKVYDTVLPSLKPVLKNTFERYSPITGAFSAMLLKNRLGADVMRQSNQAFTSDASLAAARMLEGLRQANLLQSEGFLADDLEIRRTQAEALARLEDNMARRSEVANFNRASINQTNRERAQLEATRLKSNWQSWDNFLQGFESRIRARIEENRERANNFYDKLSANQAEEWYNNAIEPAKAALLAWTKTNEGRNADYTEWSEWNRYLRYLKEARERANAMIYQGMANRYGLRYTNPYSDESNALFNWDRRYI